MLLNFTALVAAGCYWWIARPTIVAERFVASINRRDEETARSMCVEEWWLGVLLGFSNQIQAAPTTFLSNKVAATDAWAADPMPADAALLPREWHDVWRGQRRVILRTSYSPKFAPYSKYAETVRQEFALIANPRKVSFLQN
jgi:hypothetical protein